VQSPQDDITESSISMSRHHEHEHEHETPVEPTPRSKPQNRKVQAIREAAVRVPARAQSASVDEQAARLLKVNMESLPAEDRPTARANVGPDRQKVLDKLPFVVSVAPAEKQVLVSERPKSLAW
jgi:hypothetical protein